MNGTDEYVCVNCFTDEGLIRFVEENASAHECSFCDCAGDAGIAAPIEDVSQHFLKSISREYDLAVNQLGWIGSEGIIWVHIGMGSTWPPMSCSWSSHKPMNGPCFKPCSTISLTRTGALKTPRVWTTWNGLGTVGSISRK